MGESINRNELIWIPCAGGNAKIGLYPDEIMEMIRQANSTGNREIAEALIQYLTIN